MTVGVDRKGLNAYEAPFDEVVVPLRGFLFEHGKLRGLYVKEGIIPVTEELPKEINEAVLRGKAKRKAIIREIHDNDGETLEVYLEVEYQSWPVHVVHIQEA